MKNRIAIGSVQFGLHYGINNTAGKVSLNVVKNILALAKQEGVDTIDTAYAYGNSENVLGENDLSNFKIISKLPPSIPVKAIKSIFLETTSRLKLDKIYGYMYHDFSSYTKESWKSLLELKNLGKVSKIGFSLYLPEQLQIILNEELDFDILQIPFNILDNRFRPYFDILKSKGVEIHTRSVFLQGLFFVESNKLNPFFKPIEPLLSAIYQIAKEENKTIADLALNFVLCHSAIDKVVIGLDSVSNLKENISVINQSANTYQWFDKLSKLPMVENKYLMPNLWQL